ncbi:MAG: putative acid phosphatase [Myxococcales bacterium]|nr:putative acid phosphatase [Myxococcales bacterium]
MLKPTGTVLLSIGLAAATGCAANTSGSTTQTCSDIVAQDLVPSPSWQGTVFTVVLENKSQADIFGNKDAPFINGLMKDNAVAAGYRDNLVHPSEPNYIWMVAGENFGILDDEAPATHHIDSQSHLVDQLEMQGLTWKAYMESMGTACGLESKYPYEPKHDPFVYFDDVNGWDGTKFMPSQRCKEHVVDYSEFDKDLAANTLAKYVFITPNMINDMHDGTVAQGDAWAAKEIPKILGSDAFNKGGVLFLTFDEGSNQKDDPPMIVISPNAKRGYTSNTSYNASSYLKTVQKILGTQPLPCNTTADTVQTMDDMFTVPLDAVKKTATP